MEIKAPVEKVYACCANVEGYTTFMESAKEIKMTGEKVAHWKMEMMGRAMEFDTEMTENVENKKIAWKSAGDLTSTGSWSFEPTAEGTNVTYVMDYEMPGIMGKIFDKLKVSKEVEKDMDNSLQKMKEFLEGT